MWPVAETNTQMWEDLVRSWRAQVQKVTLHQHCIQQGWDAVDLRWWKGCFKDLINPTSTSSTEKDESVDSEVGSPITGAEATEVVKKLSNSRASGMDDISPEFLTAWDVVGLFWLRRFCKIM